ncbi:MAG: LysM peptidoglycan-binding domain-containing protein [Phycisphaerales bacterium]|nr:LysM peptidoglycan-binding domain-containing protein [Phycisphaerales bacterium]
MAYETKVGLLVGLGFIVCFAVVLSHRGKADELSAQMAYEVLTRHGTGERSEGTTIPNLFARRVPAGRQAESTNRGTGSAGEDVGGGANGPPVRRETEKGSRGPGDEVGADGRVRLASAPSMEGADTAGTHDEVPNTRSGISMESVFGNVTEPAVDSVPVSGTELAAGRVSQNAAKGPAGESKGSRRANDVRYVVRPKDTLWGIADRAYGRATQAVVDSIVEANRGRLGAMKVLPVGTELILPAAEGAKPATNRAAADEKPTKKGDRTSVGASDSSRGAMAKAKPEAASRREYYQVQPGDRYASLAEKFLGDKSKWRELYEMNKDIFPDPGSIKSGVRIRVPAREGRGLREGA